MNSSEQARLEMMQRRINYLQDQINEKDYIMHEQELKIKQNTFKAVVFTIIGAIGILALLVGNYEYKEQDSKHKIELAKVRAEADRANKAFEEALCLPRLDGVK